MTVTESLQHEQDELLPRLKAYEGRRGGPTVHARDPVNQAMIRHWCDAMGDTNPIYTDPDAAAASLHVEIVAPPTMLQAWTMPGLGAPITHGHDADTDDHSAHLRALLDEHGFTSVVATNCEQQYARYLRLGDHLSVESVIDTVSERKQTALGEGYFVTTLLTYRDQDGEVVATMLFRILKFRPNSA